MPLNRKRKSNATPRVLVVGAMNMDVQAVASRVAIAGDSTPGSITSSAGGVGRNIAEGLSRLSVATTLLTTVADDDAGRQLLTHCKDVGMEVVIARPEPASSEPANPELASPESVGTEQGFNTPSYVSLYSEDGDLLYAVNDMRMIEQLSVASVPQLDQLIASADMCVIDANLPEEIIGKVARKSDRQLFVADGVSVAKCQRLECVLPKLSLLKVNLLEAQSLTGTDVELVAGEIQLESLLQNLLYMGPEKVLLTLGQDGAVLAEKADGKLSIYTSDAPEVAVKSVNGAGDALMAGFLAAMLYGKDPAEQLHWGTVCASLSLETDKACSEHLSIERMKSSEKDS